MRLPEHTGIHCAFCNGPIYRHREYGVSWLECQSCGCQKAIARAPARGLAVAPPSRPTPLRSRSPSAAAARHQPARRGHHVDSRSQGSGKHRIARAGR
jgi:hypothetical protein